MIALSFLGTGNYLETEYFDIQLNSSFKSKYFTEALYNIYKPDKIFVALTSDAKNQHCEELKSKIKFESIDIPKGKTNDEIWEMFSIISDSIPSNQELLIDITHGFRSQPILAVSMSIFLRVVKKVKIKKIIYGAFEARENNITPIFDITSFVNLIDWSYATDIFITKGNGIELVELLNNLHNKLRIEQEVFSNLKSFAKTIEDITESLKFIRPQYVSKFGKELNKKIEKINTDIKSIKEVKPLGYLLNTIPDSFKNLIIDNEDNLFSDAGFKLQTEMIKFYIETDQLVHAITLTREFIVSSICKKMNLKFVQSDERKEAEDLLNEWVNFQIKKVKLEDFAEEYAQLWSQIRDARNDINHAGMRKDPIAASKLKNNIIEYCKNAIELYNKYFPCT